MLLRREPNGAVARLPATGARGGLTPARRSRLERERNLLTRAPCGRGPDARPELALVARRLIGTPARRRLADALDRVVREAAEHPRPEATACR